MPFPGGTQGAHDDSQHQGSAKKAIASGLASLDAGSKVVQEPASKGQASGLASLDASSHVPAAQLGGAEMTANKNAVNGYAGLDAGSKLSAAQMALMIAQTDVTASRAINSTVYQNTSTRPMLVNISTSNTTAGINLQIFTDNQATPNHLIINVSYPVAGYFVSISFIVLPGNYYYALVTGGAVTLNKWIETV